MHSNGVEGLYVKAKSGNWILVTQKHDKSPIWHVTVFFRMWRIREEMLGANRVRVIKSDKAIITPEELGRD